MNSIKCASAIKMLSMGAVLCAACLVASPAKAQGHRAYYSTWTYHPQHAYYYVHYYYRPAVTYTTYRYHYCIYYPSRPRFVYYYNPYRRVYWGRYDLDAKGYSLLAEKDRKESLKDIPEAAFPAPGEMPAIPESSDGEKMATPPETPQDAK